ncbi:MAG: glycoside hydrolase family 3 N-terminal domain-containing protein [Thermodesulfobacteriota bacterium]
MKTLEQSLYQLIISRLEGERLSSASYRDRALQLARKGIGGFIVFGGENINETRDFIAELQGASDTLLFIASDIERGVGQQIKGATDFPSLMAIAAMIGKDKTDDLRLFANSVKAIAEESAYMGINMPLIPVLDVNTNPENPIICTRAFSDDSKEVARLGSIYIKTIEESGLISSAKHFPGHGDTSIDSHISLPVISKSLKDLTDTDIWPFAEAIKQGVSSIMLGHISVPALDSLPATISKKITTGLLRRELGYEGLILTDALIMHALKDVTDICTKSLNAGADILLLPADADSAVAELKDSVKSGAVSEETIHTAKERILKYKSEIKNLQSTEPDYEKNKKLSAQITDKSITLVKETAGVLPITKDQNLTIIIAGEESDPAASPHSPLKELLPDSSRVHYLSKGNPLEAFSVKGSEEIVIIAIFTNVAAWHGSSGIGEEEKIILRKLVKESGRAIVLSFGSPYVLRDFQEADVLIAAYDKSVQAERSTVKCLTGEIDFKGLLPVNLSLR